MQAASPSDLSARQRGDFQTPPALASMIWASLDVAQFALVIEPTFGLGSFLATMPEACTADVLGWEIHRDYYQATIEALSKRPVRSFRLHHGDVMAATADDVGVPRGASLLVIGNPPWVTNAEQGVLGGRNTGPKRNVKALSGLDALTGKANFDISEAIILHLIALVERYAAVQFALLTKSSVLRNLLSFVGRHPRIGDFEFHRIDSRRYFDAAADAGLLKFRINDNVTRRDTCPVYEGIDGPQVAEIGLIDNQLVHDLPAYRRTRYLERCGTPSYIWRQGVKHDLRDVFELIESSSGLRNRRGELVDLEEDTLFHLYKSSDVFHGRPSRFVTPVYQRHLQDDLRDVAPRFPRLWSYLNCHADDFRRRKSSIYRRRPLFSVFGIGAYTYCRYKIAIGALYDKPVFRLLAPTPRPVITDDTCYIVATDDLDEAVYLLAVLTLDDVQDFLLSISYRGDKRRFSKDVLMRLWLPPVHECPTVLREALTHEWAVSASFSPASAAQLQRWLFATAAIQQPSVKTRQQRLF